MTINLKADSNIELVKYYLNVLHMFHKLGKTELRLMEVLITNYLDYKKKLITDKDTFEWIFSKSSKDSYKSQLGIKDQRFVNILYSLRKKKILIGETINKTLIPSIKENKATVNYIINLT